MGEIRYDGGGRAGRGGLQGLRSSGARPPPCCASCASGLKGGFTAGGLRHHTPTNRTLLSRGCGGGELTRPRRAAALPSVCVRGCIAVGYGVGRGARALAHGPTGRHPRVHLRARAPPLPPWLAGMRRNPSPSFAGAQFSSSTCGAVCRCARGAPRCFSCGRPVPSPAERFPYHAGCYGYGYGCQPACFTICACGMSPYGMRSGRGAPGAACWRSCARLLKRQRTRVGIGIFTGLPLHRLRCYYGMVCECGRQ